MMHLLLQDLRLAGRTLRKNPGSTLVIVFSLAIGIGANTAVFSVIDALLLHPLPYPQPERLAAIWLHLPGLGIFRDWPSPGQYIDIQNENHSFDEMALAAGRNFTLGGREQPVRVSAMRMQSSLLAMLGAKARLGRLLLPEDDHPGKAPISILTDPLWRRMFNSDPAIVGKAITLNGTSYTVVGVLGPEFLLNNEVMPAAEGPIDKIDMVLPLPLGPDAAQRRQDESYNIMVRLKAGVSLQQAQEDLNAIANRIREKDRLDRTFGMHIVGLQDQVVGDVRRVLLVLLGSVAAVLLIACANVANLLLTRAAGRAREIAIRTALGAKWQRVVRQLLTESVLLALLGGTAGLMIAEWSLHVMRSIKPGNIPRMEEIGISGTVLTFTFVVSLLTGILFGLVPAWHAIKVDLNSTLKAGGRSGQGDAGLRVSRRNLRGLLVICEIALSVVLVAGAGLLIRSFARLQNVQPGFASENVLVVQVSVNGKAYGKSEAVAGFYREVESRIAHLPGVIAEGATSVLPLAGSLDWGSINVEGYTPAPGDQLQADLRVVSPDYFRTMQIPMIQGRFFEGRDTSTAPQVAIIDQRFAQRFWPHESPIGKHLSFDPKTPYTIVGVVGVVKQEGLESNGKIAVYLPYSQISENDLYLVVRASSNVTELATPVVREMHAIDPTAAVYNITTMQDLLQRSLARPRFSATLLGSFALFALILAALGVFGVLSYLVSQNIRDIGLRMALGAQPSHIFALVVKHGMALAGIGILAGLAGAAVLTRFMSSLLFEVRPTDALTFISVPVILAAIALVATVVPARRAIRVDPLVTLREE
jgi:predicted permease